MKILHNFAGGILAAALAWPGAVSADAVIDWNDIASNAVTAGRPGAIGLQDLAVVHLAMHDAIQSYERRFDTFYGAVPNPTGSKEAAAAAAAHGVLQAFYSATQGATLTTAYTTWLANNGLTGDPGIEVGEAVAAKAASLRRKDPDPPLPPFTGGTGIGEWRPTESFNGPPGVPPGPPPSFAPMAFLQMATFEPLGITGPQRFRAPPPPDINSDAYVKAYNEVKEKGALENSTRTPWETETANFWTDNPILMWQRALRAIALQRVPNLGNKARLFALANLAAADTTIVVWDSKRFHNFWRPLTAIREDDGNPLTDQDPAWKPFINTPNYPEHTSGQNGLAGAFTKSMELFFGRDDIRFVITSNAPAAIKKSRTYPSFSAASQEVVKVRILHGIHFRFADVAGRTQGRSVATYIQDHYLLPLSN
jgi:hypothetical protein